MQSDKHKQNNMDNNKEKMPAHVRPFYGRRMNEAQRRMFQKMVKITLINIARENGWQKVHTFENDEYGTQHDIFAIK